MPEGPLEALGWGEPFASALADGLVAARVIAAHRGRVVAATADDARLTTLRGALATPPVVGDWVALDGAGTVCAVLPRRTVLTRSRADGTGEQALAANVDVAFVVTSPNRDLNARRVERFVALAGGGGAQAVLVLNKADLVADPEPALGALRAAAPGAPVLVTSATDGRGVEALEATIGARRTAVLLGSSGVGKSTLVNALLGAERQATAPVRARDDRGRHTTTHRELFALRGGGLLVDTPGLRLPRMASGPAGVAAAFADIDALAQECRFADCRHEGEPGCAVAAAIESGTLSAARLEHWRRLGREERWATERAAQRRTRERGRAVRERRDG